MMPNPEIVNTLDGIKQSVIDFNSAMKKDGRPEFIHYSIAIVQIKLIDVFAFSDKKWNNPKLTTKKNDIMASCFKLLDNYHSEYRVLIAPCKDNNGVVWNTVQSAYRSLSNKLDWKTLLHSDKPIVDGTKYIALYNCNAPEIYYPNANIISTLPPKNSSVDPIIRKV